MKALIASLSFALLASAPSQPTIRHLNPSTLPPAKGYTHVVTASGGRTIYVSGQVPVGTDGKVVGAGDLTAQSRQVFENLKAALAAADATTNDIVKLTFFLTDASQIAKVRAVRDEYLKSDPPASSAVEVRALIRPEAMLEVEAIAVAR